MVDLGGYVIILVETRDKRIKLYGTKSAGNRARFQSNRAESIGESRSWRSPKVAGAEKNPAELFARPAVYFRAANTSTEREPPVCLPLPGKGKKASPRKWATDRGGRTSARLAETARSPSAKLAPAAGKLKRARSIFHRAPVKNANHTRHSNRLTRKSWSKTLLLFRGYPSLVVFITVRHYVMRLMSRSLKEL